MISPHNSLAFFPILVAIAAAIVSSQLVGPSAAVKLPRRNGTFVIDNSNNAANIFFGISATTTVPFEEEEEGAEQLGQRRRHHSLSPRQKMMEPDLPAATQGVEEAAAQEATIITAAEHPYIVFARAIYSWLVPSMVFILLMAVIGNGLIVVSAPWLSGDASHYNWLCISLAGADAWASSLLIAGLILNSYVPVVLKIAWDGRCVAALLEIFRIAGMFTSNLHILALAAHQFLGICHPLLYKTTITSELVRLLILILWVVPIAFVGIWFIAIPGDSLFSNGGCHFDFYTRLPFRLYIFVAFASILLLTMLIYVHILIYLLRQKAQYKQKRSSMFHLYRRRVQSKMKLLTTTLLILSTFTLSWGVCVLYFVVVCKQDCPLIYMESISFQTGLILNSSVNFLVALKLVFNPLIYALRMCHIRKSVSELFGIAALRSRSLSSQLLTIWTAASRQCSSPRPSYRTDGGYGHQLTPNTTMPMLLMAGGEGGGNKSPQQKYSLPPHPTLCRTSFDIGDCGGADAVYASGHEERELLLTTTTTTMANGTTGTTVGGTTTAKPTAAAKAHPTTVPPPTSVPLSTALNGTATTAAATNGIGIGNITKKRIAVASTAKNTSSSKLNSANNRSKWKWRRRHSMLPGLLYWISGGGGGNGATTAATAGGPECAAATNNGYCAPTAVATAVDGGHFL